MEEKIGSCTLQQMSNLFIQSSLISKLESNKQKPMYSHAIYLHGERKKTPFILQAKKKTCLYYTRTPSLFKCNFSKIYNSIPRYQKKEKEK